MRHRALVLVAALLAGACAQAAPGESYPVRPIRMLMPQPPGGTMETIGRFVARHVREEVRVRA
jgi:tripartite-type tricarboxylate transporter receptor subunit TctC